ncbi:MAG: hypothetical protein KIT75_03520 [Planctomycetota bacterium]|nr:hypothetical protein [Planctomycetota bacterium]
MADTGKIIPQVSAKGVFLPWPLVAAMLLSGLVPLWTLSVKAIYLADSVGAVVENDKRQDERINNNDKRLAVIEGRK